MIVRYKGKGLHFRHLDKSTFFIGTPLEEVIRSGRIDKSPTPIVNLRYYIGG